MKRFSKIFFAIAALAAYSCATDATEDLDIKVGDQTTFTISLDESRTQLGLPNDNGFYPVTWSAGDKISVNGVESSEAVISSDNPASATFTVTGVTAPYRVAYPAAADNQVLFAAEQTHTEGSFANGVSTMYGYNANGGGVVLCPLTGVLKIGVTGEAKLTYAQISTVGRAPIAGAFDLDFTTGEVTPSATATPIIGYSFGEGLQLTSTAQYLHIAVPAGEYYELYVTLYDADGGVMYATVTADAKRPVSAGVVREFKTPIAYAAKSDVLVIRDVASLKAYAEALAATTADAPLTKEGVVIADVDMSEVTDWTPVKGFASAPLNGNGYAIKGITKPLFDSVVMDIKGLHLKGVNIEETERVVVGSLACYYSGTMSHCSAEGTLVQNNTTYAATAIGSYQDINIGGMIGRAIESNISYCENGVDVVLKSLSAGEVAYASAIGGVVGATGDVKADSSSYFTQLVNRGDLTYAATAHKGNIYMSGVVGRTLSDNAVQELTYCTNYGALSMAANAVTSNDILLGGITGTLTKPDAETHHWTNYGDITLQGKASHAYAMGMIGFRIYSELYDCDNYGKISAKNLTVNSKKSIILAGFFYQSYGQLYNLTNHKEATITVENSTAQSAILIGGIAYAPLITKYTSKSDKMYNINNYAEIVVTNSSYGSGISYIGGLFGQTSTDEGTADTNVIYDECNNYGNITLDGIKATANKRLAVGGLCGARYTGIVQNCDNSGNITIKNAVCGQDIMVGGLDAYITASGIDDLERTYTDCNNYGCIIVSPTSVVSEGSGGMFIGGVFGQHFCNIGNNQTFKYTRVNNYGYVDVSGVWSQTYSSARYGQCAGGWGGDILSHADFIDCHNHGSVTVKTSGPINKLIVGGFIGLSYSRNNGATMLYQNCSNSAPVKIMPTAKLGVARVGGFIGEIQDQYDYVLTVDGCRNSGPIRIGDDANALTIDTLYLGGIFGSACESTSTSDTTTITYKTNYSAGDIEIGNVTITNPSTSYVGGAVGLTTLPMNDFQCYLHISIVGGTSVAQHGFVTGMSRSEGSLVTNCAIGGAIAISGNQYEDVDNGTITIIPVFEHLTESNYFNYIYGGTTDWSGVEGYDGCSFLSEAIVF